MMGPTIRRGKRGKSAAPQVMLTSMIDMFTILLVFLLKSYTAVDITPAADMKLPLSTAERPPEMALKITISKEAILLDDREIAPIKEGEVHSALKKSLLIVPLYDALGQHQARRLALAKEHPNLRSSCSSASLSSVIKKHLHPYLMKYSIRWPSVVLTSFILSLRKKKKP